MAARVTERLQQSGVIDFLRRPDAWPGHPSRIDVIETHGAIVFLAGDEVLKVKRAVRLPYLDFSTLQARHHFLEREIEINAPHAPGLYRDLVAITCDDDGRLEIGGVGEPVEWALRMRRFEQDQLLSHVVSQHGLSRDLAAAVADAVVRFHESAPRSLEATDPMPDIAGPVIARIKATLDPEIKAAAASFEGAIQRALATGTEIRELRAPMGYIRRCHGDLHLGNVVVWNGTPVLFDAIEFDEKLATIDTLYDLAFLLLDLERHGARQAANVILNRYLWKTGDPMDLRGLQALPLFLGVRAGIRAMVALDRARLGAEPRHDLSHHVIKTLKLGTELAASATARLIAIGGLSGTGKTTLAAALAPEIGAAPGAIHVRTDLERKWLSGAGEFERLPESAYAQDSAAAVYERVLTRGRLALTAGYSVILDGVFARPEERGAVAALAQAAGVPFSGLWLEAAPAVMTKRVAARVRDASDATPAVVDRQLALQVGAIEWARVDASGAPDCVFDAVCARLKIPPLHGHRAV